MTSNEKVRQLIKDWLEYTKKNNIVTPEDTDLKTFLLSKGYDGNIVTRLVAELPEVVPTFSKNTQYGTKNDPWLSGDKPVPLEKDKKDLSMKEVQMLRDLTDTLRDNYSRKQLDMLKKELLQ